MLAGVDAELNLYRHLLEARVIPDQGVNPNIENEDNAKPQETDFSKLVKDISAKLEKLSVPTKFARSYARQAIAAYPRESNLDILFAYALALHMKNGEQPAGSDQESKIKE